MINITSLQQLVNSVNTIHGKVETAQKSVLFESESNTKSSEFHLRFDKLMSKFSVFAEDYRFELEQFHKLLINNINKLKLEAVQARIEKERLAIEEKLETISNSNKEIVNNLIEIENSSAASVKDDNSYCMTSRSPPAPTPPPIYTNKTKQYVPKKKTPKQNNNNNNAPRKNATPIKPKTVRKVNINNEEKYNNTASDSVSDNGSTQSYKWEFRGVAKSSTRIFIGNIPSDINAKSLASWVRIVTPVRPNQITDIQIRNNAYGKYVLVRFSNKVDIHKIKKFINRINNERIQCYEEKKRQLEKRQKAQQDKQKEKGVKGRVRVKHISDNKIYETISWKKQVRVKIYKNFSNDNGYESNTLYIRNFDILDKNCHFELTQKLKECGGELVRDVEISLDRHMDPYCIATFKDIDDAVYCCTSEIEFNGRTIEMRYFR